MLQLLSKSFLFFCYYLVPELKLRVYKDISANKNELPWIFLQIFRVPKSRYIHKNIESGLREYPEDWYCRAENGTEADENSKGPRRSLDYHRNGEECLEKALIILFNKCVVEGKIYKTWKNAEVIIIFKNLTQPT